PTVDEIFQNKHNNIINNVKSTIEEASEDFQKFIPIATQLDEDYSLVDVAAALLKIVFDKESSFDYTSNSIEAPVMDETRLFMSVGRRDGITPKSLVNFLKETARISPKQVGDIDIKENFCFANVDADAVNNIMKKSMGKKLNKRTVNIEVAKKRK
ncbi:DbpA RNA binding domain-containing protein, partial [Clostridium perfringens]